MTDFFKRPRSWLLVLLMVVIAGPGWIALSRPGNVQIDPAPRTGAPAPAFTAQTLDGSTLALADYRGQVVVLNLWATWCGPCRAEMPALERIHARYADEGVVILGLNQGATEAEVRAFAEEHDLTFPLALDPAEQIGRVYELEAFPTTFFIDRDGVIRDVVYGGPMAEALVERNVRDLLKD
ncbi:MAG: TlpA family protein disulfide reductase [Anaerolineae bacterium]|nr:TlpA family protein disulfide reductase [Anaerolineae bacterium]